MKIIRAIQGRFAPTELSYDGLAWLCDGWRAVGETISFANGCFDVLHEGHLELLQEARKRADRLVVAVNPDRWIARHKGPGRPLQTETIRCSVAHCVSNADLSLVFDDETAESLLSIVKPDYYVIGSDYRNVKIMGAEHCGEIVIMERIPGVSTTATITRTQQAQLEEASANSSTAP